MKEYFRSLTAAIGTTATLFSAGCGSFDTQRKVCEMTGGEIKNIDGPARAREICTENKAHIMKCLKTEEGSGGETVVRTIKCSDKMSGSQISEAFSDADYTICHASKDADKIEISCK